MSRACFLCCVGPKSHKTSEVATSRPDATPDTVELATGLSAHDRKLIKETSEIIFSQLHLQNKGVAFLIAFFKAYPHHQRYFKMFRGLPPDELISIPHTENHGRRVMNQMALLVQHLEEPAVIKEQLIDLMTKHQPRSVKPRQMKDMLSMFVEFTSQQLGAKFTSHHEAAWKKMTSHILSVLEDANQHANGNIYVVDNGRTCQKNGGELGITEEYSSHTGCPSTGDAEEVDAIRPGSEGSESGNEVAVVDISHGDCGQKW